MSTPVHTPDQPAVRPPIPPLRQGDHLSADEFLRRYEAMPQVKKAELIQGVVYMPSPSTSTAGSVTTTPSHPGRREATTPPSASARATFRSRTGCSVSFLSAAVGPAT